MTTEQAIQQLSLQEIELLALELEQLREAALRVWAHSVEQRPFAERGAAFVRIDDLRELKAKCFPAWISDVWRDGVSREVSDRRRQ